MARRRSDLGKEVADVVAEAKPATRAEHPDVAPRSLAAIREEREQARRVQALTYRLAGLTFEEIGRRLEITASGASDLVRSTLKRAENESVEELRQIENMRLDRAQAAIWSKVLDGDEKAISTYLAISSRRANLNGLDAPKQIMLAVSIRQEMEAALGELEAVLGVMDAEVVEDDE